MSFAIPVRYDDEHFVSSCALSGLPGTAELEVGVGGEDVVLRKGDGVG